MKFNSQELLTDLKNRTTEIIGQIEELQKLSVDQLNSKLSSESWSVLECIEHLNLYADFYNPEIRTKMKAWVGESRAVFKSGVLGNYFAKSVSPKEKLNRMNTFKDKNPEGSSLDKKVLDKFLKYQHETVELLDLAAKVDIQKVKTAITISNLIKLRLGDTFRVVIYHNQRHMIQALKAVKV